MKYLRLFESFEDIDKICRKYNIVDYTINPDESIDSTYVNLRCRRLTKLPLKFNKINGIFNCSWNNLITLEGSPVEVNGSFWCNKNKLTSFEFAPKIIRGNFDCSDNNIKSFEYFPSFVKGYFGCYENDPRKHQIGGGYGASGIMSIEHTRLLSYSDYDTVHYNRNIISKVCSDVKKYSMANF